LECILDNIESTMEIAIPTDPFEYIIGQDDAVALVKTAVLQHRHLLLCGEPGVGKSMLAKAAATLLPPPREEIRIRANPDQPNRPLVVIKKYNEMLDETTEAREDTIYIRPEDLPFEVGVKMGYRCPVCGGYSTPDQGMCFDCGSAKRCDWVSANAYHGLFRALDIIYERALPEVVSEQTIEGVMRRVTYRRDAGDTIQVTIGKRVQEAEKDLSRTDELDNVIVPINSYRFIRVSGATAVELLGDIKHDPYGGTGQIGTPPHMQVVPGAIHEAHEGILYVDEIATLGILQKFLLTAMQEKKFPITGHNPQSSGAAVRVDNVPCDFILFASTNFEDVASIIQPLRSRIRGYGYEIVLSSWTEKNTRTVNDLVRFVAQTVVEDGRIPHFGTEAVKRVIEVAERMAQELDHQENALTLRLRELGGVIRIAGDLAVRDGCELVEPTHVRKAEELAKDRLLRVTRGTSLRGQSEHQDFGSYFF